MENQKQLNVRTKRSPRGTPPTKNNQGRMGSVHAPPFVPRDTGRQLGPRGTNGRMLPPPPYQYEKEVVL